MNRVGLGLAVGAGYVLGRRRKLKLAVVVGTMVAGKRMNLGPRSIADLVSRQLLDSAQFKEIGDQLRGDLRGVGKAAAGALVERRIEGLADRLHGRTAQVRDQLSGAAPERSERDEDAHDDDAYDEEDERARASGADDEDGAESGEEEPERGRPAPARKTAARAAEKAPAKKKASAKKTAAPAAGKGTAKKAAAEKTAAKKTTPAKKTARKATRSRATRGGGGDD
ncbi:DNA primase [Streptomyces sp. HM190]|uniref:DNA primase n=1 Tax=Streptomyces sp. HM190 TaxID=2695266 RepID=UPI00135AF17E|nr:DNA primase [Streptomyces sp. HM190]